MRMSYKTYKIWRILLDNPNDWMSVKDVARDMNMTSRQVSSVVGMMPSPPVRKERDEGTKELMMILEAGEEEVRKMRYDLIHEFFGISDDMCAKIEGALSPIGWLSVADLSEDTGIEIFNVTKVLSILPNVVSRGTGSVSLYRLKV